MKSEVRRSVLAARSALPSVERLLLSQHIASRATSLLAFRRARTVALYAPAGAEVDTGAIALAARAAGKRVAFPRISPASRALDFVVCAERELVAVQRGIREPLASCEPLPAAELELLFVPGVAFDGEGHRLGRGAGHYDATLAALPSSALAVGLAFEVQVLPVPVEEHDVPLDLLVTESRIHLFRRRARPHLEERAP